MKGVPEDVHSLLGKISVGRGIREPVHSSDVTTEHLEKFAEVLRKITNGTKQNIVALIGTLRAADYAIAASRAVSSESLQIESSCSGRTAKSLILACAAKAPHEDASDARDTVYNAMRLSQVPEMQGRAGILYKDTLWALPGLSRSGEPTSFDSRYGPIARFKRGAWGFNEAKEAHIPVGDANKEHEYRLDTGVQAFDIGGEVGPVVASVQGAKQQGLSGMILRTSRSTNGELFSSHSEMLDALNAEEIPGIVVSNSLCQHGAQCDSDEECPYDFISHGGGLTETEARLLMAEWLADATNLELEPQEKAAYVKQMLSVYPFRN